jgi:tRNA/rRNA methyltransferase
MKTRFVLIETSHAGNVGGVARAMKVMGFDDLVLVRPRFDNVLRREETLQRSSGAQDVLKNARVVQTLEEALTGMTHWCATAMTPRDFGPPTRTPREHFEILKAEEPQPKGIAFLFGSERFGMTNEDVYRCHVALSIPTNPNFGSLNLASAAQVIAYEWRLSLGGATSYLGADAMKSTAADQASRELADGPAIAGLLAHWESSLVEIGFLDPLAPKKLMPRLQQLFNRAHLSPEEVHILRGVAKHMALKRASKELD